jgi:histone H3/H4
MKSVEKIIKEYWREKDGFRNYFISDVEEIAKRYAKEVLKEAAEKAEAFISVDDTPRVIKKSILNIELK